MITLPIYIYSQNTDLHAVSAYEAVTSVLGQTQCRALKRYRRLDLSFDVATADEAKRDLEQLLSVSYHLLNPNKEGYFLEGLPVAESTDDLATFFCQVSSDDLSAEARQILGDIRRAFSTSLSSISQSIVWEVHVDRQGRDVETVQDEFVEGILLSTSHKKGLLVNPVLETVQFLAPEQVLAKAHA